MQLKVIMSKLFKFSILLIFLTSLVCCDQQNLCKFPIDSLSSHLEISLQQKDSEGFLAGTLIRTIDGYVPVELLVVGDFLNGIDYDREIDFSCKNQIIYIKKNYLTQYVQLQIDSELINVALNQRFYLLDKSLKAACDLEIGDTLSASSYICAKRIINEPCVSYCIGVQQHSFLVYPNIGVHNFDVATISASGTLVLGFIEVLNPIALLVGIMVPLSLYAIQQFRCQAVLLSKLDEQDDALSESQIALKNREVLFQTRNYYEAKRKELLGIYQDLIKIKNDLVVFIKPNQLNALHFSNGFLQQIQPLLFNFAVLPNISYEVQLSLSDKEKLIKIRDDELEGLQQAILDLHLVLAFHVNEIIERRDQAQRDLDIVIELVNNSIDCWNRNLCNMPYDVAIHEYEIHFVWKEMLDYFESKINEVEWILIYYEKLKNHFFVSQTTTLLNVLDKQVKINDAHFERIKSHRIILLSNMLNHESFLRQHGFLSQQLINQCKIVAQKYRENKDNSNNVLADAKKKQIAVQEIFENGMRNQGSVASAGGPDPDDDWFKKLKNDADKMARHQQFGKFYRDSQTKLWWSKSNAPHAGPHYKVFQERATGLEWVWDVDLLGKVMNKHKGPIGRFIPYRELIFLS